MYRSEEMGKMDEVYEAAVNRRDELQLELKQLNDFIELYRATRQRLGLDSSRSRQVDSLEPPATVLTPHVSAPLKAPPKPRVTDNPNRTLVAQAAKDILLAAGRAMTRRELHGALKARGLEVRGGDPLKTLGTMLWRAKGEFVQVEGYGYWPSDEMYPPKPGQTFEDGFTLSDRPIQP
jgi:hypothetical protein